MGLRILTQEQSAKAKHTNLGPCCTAMMETAQAFSKNYPKALLLEEGTVRRSVMAVLSPIRVL